MANNSNSSNRINVPEARQAMENMKYEVAGELGINLKKGYNGDLASKDAGHIGGNMVKNVLPIRTREHSLVVDKRFIGRRLMPVHYRMRLAL